MKYGRYTLLAASCTMSLSAVSAVRQWLQPAGVHATSCDWNTCASDGRNNGFDPCSRECNGDWGQFGDIISSTPSICDEQGESGPLWDAYLACVYSRIDPSCDGGQDYIDYINGAVCYIQEEACAS